MLIKICLLLMLQLVHDFMEGTILRGPKQNLNLLWKLLDGPCNYIAIYHLHHSTICSWICPHSCMELNYNRSEPLNACVQTRMGQSMSRHTRRDNTRPVIATSQAFQNELISSNLVQIVGATVKCP